MSFDLSGQRVVITGVTGGIARATAQRLLAAGAEVVVSARSEAKVAAAVDALGGRAVSGQVMDLLDPQSIDGFFQRVGAFDHLVTPAATGMFAPIRDMDLPAARELLESKQWGQMLCVHHAAKRMSPTGSITLFSGTVTQKPLAGGSIFAAAGGATEAAGRVWAFELAPIRVNMVVPGVIDTAIWATLMGDEAAAQTYSAMAEALPVKRVGTPDDVAKAVLFLIDNGFVDGHSLVVDGGHRLI